MLGPQKAVSTRDRRVLLPFSRHASASSRMRSFYCAVNRRRFARSGTSGSGLVVLEIPRGTSKTKDRSLPLSTIWVFDLILRCPLRPIYYNKLGGKIVSLYIGTQCMARN